MTILRLFNVYGPAADGSDRSTVETIFLKRILAGQAPVIKGNPAEGRDFIHIDDVVRCLRLVLNDKNSHNNGEIINVGCGVLTTLPELAQKLIKLTGARLDPLIEAGREQRAPLQIQADTTRAKKRYGFEARISLEEGLAALKTM